MPDLEEQLAALAPAIDWPLTPTLKVALPTHGVVSGEAERRGRRPANNRWILAAAAALLIVATLLAYTPSREAIARWLNLHTTIQRVQNPPTPSPLPSGPLGERLGLGTPTTLENAQSQLAWKIEVPPSLGRPVEDVTVKGRPGYWISGSPHDFVFADANGDAHYERLRLATNTLIFDDNGTVIRIEGDMTKSQALELAGSLS